MHLAPHRPLDVVLHEVPVREQKPRYLGTWKNLALEDCDATQIKTAEPPQSRSVRDSGERKR